MKSFDDFQNVLLMTNNSESSFNQNFFLYDFSVVNPSYTCIKLKGAAH